MSEHNHTGLDEAASVASNTMQAVRTGKAISAAARGVLYSRCLRRQRALRQAGPMELP